MPQVAQQIGELAQTLSLRTNGHKATVPFRQGLLSYIQPRHDSIRLLSIVCSVDVCPFMRRAGVPEPFLCGLYPAGLPIDQLRDPTLSPRWNLPALARSGSGSQKMLPKEPSLLTSSDNAH